MKVSLCFVFVFVVACGGKISDGDGGIVGDDSSTGGGDSGGPHDASIMPDIVSPPPPPPGMCGNFNVDGTTSSNGDCSVSATWQCGATSYAIMCSCPGAMCSCSEQTESMGSGTTVNAPSVCSSQCSPTVPDLAKVCGFPTQ